MTTIALRSIPAPGSIIINEARSLIAHFKWELLFMGMVIFIYQLSTLNRTLEEGLPTNLLLFQDGALSIFMQFVMVLFGAFWAFRIWEGLQVGERSNFLSYPAGRVTHQFLRIAAGAVVFVSVIALFWLAGATVSEIFVPGYSWFSAPEYSGAGWLVTLLGVVNVYLYATILALLFRRPEIWFLAWIPATLALSGFIFFRLKLDLLANIIGYIFSSPGGALAGFGLQTEILEPVRDLPTLGVLLMWTAIYSGGAYFAARFHRED